MQPTLELVVRADELLARYGSYSHTMDWAELKHFRKALERPLCNRIVAVLVGDDEDPEPELHIGAGPQTHRPRLVLTWWQIKQARDRVRGESRPMEAVFVCSDGAPEFRVLGEAATPAADPVGARFTAPSDAAVPPEPQAAAPTPRVPDENVAIICPVSGDYLTTTQALALDLRDARAELARVDGLVEQAAKVAPTNFRAENAPDQDYYVGFARGVSRGARDVLSIYREMRAGRGDGTSPATWRPVVGLPPLGGRGEVSSPAQPAAPGGPA